MSSKTVDAKIDISKLEISEIKMIISSILLVKSTNLAVIARHGTDEMRSVAIDEHKALTNAADYIKTCEDRDLLERMLVSITGSFGTVSQMSISIIETVNQKISETEA